MEIAPYSLPQPLPEPLFDSGTPEEQPRQQLPEMEIDVDALMSDINSFSGDPEEARVLTNLYIGHKIGTIPKPEDYNANVNSYMYSGAADNDPIKNLEHIRRGFAPEEDKAYTQLQDFEALTPEEQWDRIKAPFEVGRGVAIGATMPAMIPQQYQQEVFVSEADKKKHINSHINKLRNSSQTWKLQQGKGFSDKARNMVNKMVMTKQPPNLFTYMSLSERERNNFFIYASGRNPKYDVGFFESLGGTISQAAVDIKDSFKKTGESIVRSHLGVEDPEEFFLRFNAKFGDTFNAESVTDDKRKEIRNWVLDQIQPTVEEGDALSIGEAYSQKTYDTTDMIMNQFEEHLEIGAQSRMQKKLEAKAKAATRHNYKTGLVGDALLTATEMGMDLGAVAALSVGTLGMGGMAYSAGRFFGDYEDSLLDAGVDPDKAKATALLTSIPYVLVEQLQAGQVFGKQFKGVANKIVDDLDIGKIATNAIKNSSNPKISKIATGARITADYVDNVSAELVEEIAQEVFSEVGKHSAIEGYELEESIGNVIETAKEAFKGLVVLGVGTPAYRGIKGEYNGDFIEQDISDTIEGTFTPLTRQEEEAIGLGDLRAEEYQEAEDKDAYLEEMGYNERQRELIHATQDIEQEEIQQRVGQLDAQEAQELKAPTTGVEALRAMTQRFEPFANIKEEGDGLRITTDKGFDFAVKFNGDIGGDFGTSDPRLATINLSEKSGLPTFNHEFGHMIRDMGGVTDTEWKSVVKIARESLGAEEVAKIIAKNKEGYEARGIKFTDDIKDHEIFANALEEWTLTGDVPVDARGALQKFLDFIKDMLAQYIGGSQSGQRVISDIQSGKILERKPLGRAKQKMERAAKRREEERDFAKVRKERLFIEEALTEAEANNKELVSAIEALSRLEQAPDFVKQKLSTQERIDQATGIVRPTEDMRPEDFITGDEIIESELPGDFFQDKAEGAGISPEELYGFGETIQDPVLKFIEENGGIARTPEIEQEIKNRFENMVATRRYVNKSGALDWDQMAELLSTEPSSPLFEREVTKDDILDYLAQDSETKFSIAPRTDSKAFKDWFGDSKVVNEDGSPKVVYHGTGAQFNEFSKKMIGTKWGADEKGFFFTSGENIAKEHYFEEGGRVIPAYVSLQNPLIINKDFLNSEGMSDIDTLGEDTITFWDSYQGLILDDWLKSEHDGVIVVDEVGFNGQADYMVVAFEPTQIKSATENIGTYDPANPDIRYSLSPRSERDAVTVLANAIVTGKAKTLAQREQILNSYKIPLENQAAIKERAFDIAEQVQSEIDSLENTQTIRNAIRKAEIKQFYDAERKAILEKGIEQGELLEMARARLKEDRKKLKEATKQQQEPLPKMDERVRSINDEMAMLKVVDDIVNDTRKKVFPKKEPKNWQRDPRILGTIRESVKSAGNYLLKNVAPGADKQKLKQQIKELSDKATYRGLRSASEKVLNNILSKAETTTRKEVQNSLKSTLKNYSSEPPAKVEARKRTIEGDRHLFLYHGYKAIGMSLEKSQEKMESINGDLERLLKKNDAGSDILIEDKEIEYRAYMTFGGLSDKEANIPDIVSAQEYAEKVIADGKALVEKLQKEHDEKYAETRQAIISAILKAKPYVEKVDDPSKISQLFDFFKTMNVREQLEYITEYGSDQEKSLLKKILDFNGTSKIKKKTRILEMNRKLEKVAQDLGIKNIENYALDRSKLEKKFRKYSHEGRTDMSRANLMQLYMTFRQLDVIEMAARVNNDGELINPDLYKRLQQMPEIRKELTDQEMRLADAMGDLISEMLPDINKAYKKQYGINMKIQPENYWSLRVQVKSAGYESVMATVSEAPGFTIQRVAHKNDLDERADIFEVFYGHVSDAAHYIETIDSQLAIRSTLTNRNFKEAVRQTYGKETLKQVDGSIVDMAIDRALNPDKGIAIIDFVRSIMSTISIGYNPKSWLVTATGAVNIFTTHKGMFRTIGAISKNPDQYKKNISTVLNSAVVQERLKQGLNEQMRNARERAKANKAVKKYVDMGFHPLSWVDSRVAALAGGAIYTEFQNSEAAAGLTPQEIETQGLALVDYAIQKAYQPTDPDMLPSAIRRGGSVIKAIFQFMTEPMSKLGLYAKDWNAAKVMWQKGKKDEAVKKALKIVIGQHIIVPAAYWMAGEIMRLGEDDDWEERLDRLAVHIMVGPMSGLLIVGTGLDIAAKHIVGEKIYLGSSTPSDRVINEVKFLLDRATNWEDEEIDEKILKIIKQYNPAVKNTLKIIED